MVANWILNGHQMVAIKSERIGFGLGCRGYLMT